MVACLILRTKKSLKDSYYKMGKLQIKHGYFHQTLAVNKTCNTDIILNIMLATMVYNTDKIRTLQNTEMTNLKFN